MPAMAYALETRTEERPATAEGFAFSGLWMLPILLLALIFDKFRRHLARLKDMRRTRPLPKDWRSFYPDLRRSEWAIHWFCFEGARRIILGQDLDLSALSLDPEPPDSFQPSSRARAETASVPVSARRAWPCQTLGWNMLLMTCLS